MTMASNDPSENTDPPEIGVSRAEDGWMRFLNKRNVLRVLVLLLIGTILISFLIGL